MDVKNHGLAVRSRAIGMIQGGITQKSVATELHVNLRSVERWWRAEKLRKSQETKLRFGRPKLLIITKSLGNRGKSTREIARKLNNKGYCISHTAVYRYLRSDLGVTSFKRPKRPRLTEKMKMNRLNFAQIHKKWITEDWKKLMWSDKSPFQMFAIPNRQNDRVWAEKFDEVEPCVQVKFPAKIHAWGMMSHQALSQLHIVP